MVNRRMKDLAEAKAFANGGYTAYTTMERIMFQTTIDAPVKFLSVQEAAELLRLSRRTLYGLVSQRAIPYRKAGRRLLFLESELVEWTKPHLQRNQYVELTR